MKSRRVGLAVRLLTGVSLLLVFGCAVALGQYNVVLLIVDQRTFHLSAGADYRLPALETIAKHGVTFQNHYIASAMCSPLAPRC